MPLASNTQNIRRFGTGRVYAGEVGGSSFVDLGECENCDFGVEISKDQLKSNRNADRAVIVESVTERAANVNIGLREMSEENLKMALLGGDINTLNQSAGHQYQLAPTLVDDEYIDLGHLDVFITKLTGTITGTLTVGDEVTGNSSGATGKIAFVGSGYVILVNVSGTFETGEQVEETADTNYITPTGIETLEDVCITSSDGASLRVAGTDYSLDPDYGYLRKLSTGSIVSGDVASYDYAAVNKKYIHAMATSSVTKKIIMVTDKDDQGPRQRITFHKVTVNLGGEFPLIGEGTQVLALEGTVLKDTTQPSGQEYFKVEMM